MTRINLVKPHELTDQHLFAEYREIKMIPAYLKRTLKTKSANEILADVPSKFYLGMGHVRFFYDKHLYLTQRYHFLVKELLQRQYNISHRSTFMDFCHDIPGEFFNNYKPTDDALKIIRARIKDRIQMKPEWYRYYRISLSSASHGSMFSAFFDN